MGKFKKNMPMIIMLVFLVGFMYYKNMTAKKASANAPQVIEMSSVNPGYWQYKGETKLLLGASDNDNLFQSADVAEQLEALSKAGGNYVRNTMSSRDEGDVWPFAMLENGKYDLDSLNAEYWNRFENFLKLAYEKDIIVQLELWATFDFYRKEWVKNPFNPANNVNYTTRRVKLDSIVDSHPVFAENNFFRSVPSQMSILYLLSFQQKYVDKLLSISLEYGNVLYCIDNETSVSADWGKFWANYIQKKAFEKGLTVPVTEMWDAHDLKHAIHAETADHPGVYAFVDISQNNHIKGEEHYKNGMWMKEYLAKNKLLRPLNNVKVYGHDGGNHKDTEHGLECYIQNVFIGCASTRFHRPNSGLGISDTALAVVKSLRMVADTIKLPYTKPSNELLKEREEGEAYCLASQYSKYAVYFPHGGEVSIDVSGAKAKKLAITWVDVLKAEMKEPQPIERSETVKLTAPGEGHWIALILKDGK